MASGATFAGDPDPYKSDDDRRIRRGRALLMSHRWAPVLAALSEAQRVLLVGHVNPDADALGSALATGMALRSLGRDVQVTFPDEPFEVPAGPALPARSGHRGRAGLGGCSRRGDLDGCLLGDRIGRLLPIGEAAQTFIAVDHHASFIPFAGINVVDAAVPATGMLALELIDELGAELTADMAVCLYAAISSDTGSFRYPANSRHPPGGRAVDGNRHRLRRCRPHDVRHQVDRDSSRCRPRPSTRWN